VQSLNGASGATGTATATPTMTSTAPPANTPTPTHTAAVPATASPTPTPTRTATIAGGTYTVRVNAGGAAYTDTAGRPWLADKAFSAGGWGYVGGSTYASSAGIANTLDDTLYQSERYWTETATPGYRFTVPAAGQYEVTLKFAEIYLGSAGRRVFSVNIEGSTVLDSYDIFADAGSKNAAVADKVFSVSVTDGVLAIDFVRIGTSNCPKISAIQVRSLY